MEAKKGRIPQIDVLRGIGILAMVIGHAGLPKPITNFIYAFHMPFFFFLTGVISNFSHCTFREFLERRVKTLLLPFVIYYFIHLFLYGFLYDRGPLGQLLHELTGRIDGALWFIPVLFFSTCLAKLLPENKAILFFSTLFMGGVSEVLAVYDVKLPFHLAMVPFGASFVLVGRLLSEDVKSFLSTPKTKIESICIGSGAIIVTFFISRVQRLSMYFEHIEPTLTLIVGALSGIMLMLVLARILSYNKLSTIFLSYTGRNTLVFVAFSQFILKFENLYIGEYAILKYSILFVVLYILVYLKNLLPFAKKMNL